MTTPHLAQPIETAEFFDAVSEVRASSVTLSADAAKSLLNNVDLAVPEAVGELVQKYDPKFHGAILDSVYTGMKGYEKAHGRPADASLVEYAVNRTLRAVTPLKDLGIGGLRLDSATNNHHDQISLVPGTPMVSILEIFDEAIPMASYLTADLKSNEARTAIFSAQAQSNYGAYVNGQSLNGLGAGAVYLDGERVAVLTETGGAGPFTYNATAQHTSAVGGLPVTVGNPAVPMLRGRCELFVNGIFAGREAVSYSAGPNPIAGQVTIANTVYSLSGSINSDTGGMTITASPALPAGTVLEVPHYVDYEKQPNLAPKIGTEVQIYSLFAHPNRGTLHSTIDALGQMGMELSLDPRGEAQRVLQKQYSSERHYSVLRKGKRIAENLKRTWDYDYTLQIAQKDYAQLWLNLFPILGELSQEMANRTIDHGIDILYFPQNLASKLEGLPSTMFQPSGVPKRAGIYRLGRLMNMWDCYYTPAAGGLLETSTTSQILAFGRSSQVARSQFILGDAVPSIILPLGMLADLNTSDGWYCRNFTNVNPYEPAARGSALIDVINLG